jgi:hypothetical protein
MIKNPKQILAMCALFFDPLSHRENDEVWAYKTVSHGKL